MFPSIKHDLLGVVSILGNEMSGAVILEASVVSLPGPNQVHKSLIQSLTLYSKSLPPL